MVIKAIGRFFNHYLVALQLAQQSSCPLQSSTCIILPAKNGVLLKHMQEIKNSILFNLVQPGTIWFIVKFFI